MASIADNSFASSADIDQFASADGNAILNKQRVGLANNANEVLQLAAFESDGEESANDDEVGSPKCTEDNPFLSVDMTVQMFGFLIFEDDPTTKLPKDEHRFNLVGQPLTVQHRGRAISAATHVQLQSMQCLDAAADNGVIISGDPTLSCDLFSPGVVGKPSTTDIGLSAGLNAHVGSAMAELLEAVMDISNLFKGPPPTEVKTPHSPTSPGSATTASPVAPEEGVRVVNGPKVPKTPEEKDACGFDTKTMILTVKLDGAKVSLYTPHKQKPVDDLVCAASVEGTILAITMREKTMDVDGGIKKIEFVYFRTQDELNKNPNADKTITVLSSRFGSEQKDILSFRYFTTYPPAPVALVPDDESEPSEEKSTAVSLPTKQKLDRARPLEFTNFVEVELQPANVIYDAYSVMILLDYFTVGFISRFAALGGRKRYDGKDIYAPPSGPQMLTSLDIKVIQPSIVLPLNDKKNPKAYLEGTVSTLRIFNSVETPDFGGKCLASTKIDLQDLELLDPSTKRPILRRTPMTISMLNSVDPKMRFAPQMILALENVVIDVDKNTYVQLLQLLCGNILAMPANEKKTSFTMPKTAIMEQQQQAAKEQAEAAAADPEMQGRTYIQAQSIGFRFGESTTDTVLFSLVLANPRIAMIKKDIDIKWAAIDISEFSSTHQQHGASTEKLFSCAEAAINISKEDPLLTAIDVDFGVRRLAVTNQWFTVVDWLVTEDSMTALAPLIGGGEEKPAIEDKKKAVEAQPEAGGMKVSVVSRQFVIPLLDASNVKQFEVHLSTMKMVYGADNAAGTMDIALDLQSVELTHSRSGLQVLSCHHLEPSSASAKNASAPNASGGLLHFTMNSNAKTKASDIGLQLSGLNTTLAMPVLYELIHYTTQEDQPPAMLPRLATMKHKRDEAVAKAAEQPKGEKGVMTVTVNWEAPTVTIPIDAEFLATPEFTPPTTDGFDINKVPALLADLGSIETTVVMDGPKESMNVTAKMSDATVSNLVEETTINFSYEVDNSIGGAQQTQMCLNVDPVGLLVSHGSLKNVMGMLNHNLSLPQPQHTVVVSKKEQKKDKALAETAPKDASSNNSNIMTIAVTSATLKLFDLKDTNFGNLSVEQVDMRQCNSIETTISVAKISGVDIATGMSVMQSGGSDHSISIVSNTKLNKMEVVLDQTAFTIVPSAIGSIIDLFLSPLEDGGADKKKKNDDDDAGATDSKNKKAAESPFHTYVTIRKSNFTLLQGTDAIALLSLDDSHVHLTANPDGSATTEVMVGPIALEDKLSKSTIYPTVLESIPDDESPMRRRQSEGEAVGSSCGGDHVGSHFISLKITNDAPLTPEEILEAAKSKKARFAQHIKAQISSISFVYVPELMAAITTSLNEASEMISNSDKAKERAAQKAEDLMSEAQALKEIDISMDRPKLVLVIDTTSTECIEIFPGAFSVNNSLIEEGAAGQVEAFGCVVEGMSVRVLRKTAFKHEEPLRVGAKFNLQPPCNTRTFVNIPVLEANVSEEQLIYLFRFGGCMSSQVPKKPDEVEQIEDAKDVEKQAKKPQQQLVVKSPAEKEPTKVLTVSLGELGVYISDKFVIAVKAMELCNTTTGPKSHAEVSLESFTLNHKSTVLLNLSMTSVGNVADATTSEVNVDVDDSTVSLTPQAVREFFEVIYKPMCKHLLHSHHEPQCKLLLEGEAENKLKEDLHIDSYAYLRVSNQKHCSFELDLGGHDLCLSGRPAPLIVLEDHCILTIRNGRLLYEGAYALSSFVHYGYNSSLHIAQSCKVKKVLFGAAAAASTSPSSANQKAITAAGAKHVDPNADPEQKTSILKAKFNSTIQLISEADGRSDFGFVLGGNASVMQGFVDDKLEKRSISVKLDKFTTLDPSMLRNTPLELQAFGDETLHMELFVPRVDFTIRVYRIKRILETVNTIVAALNSSTSSEEAAKYSTATEYEDEDAYTLFVSTKPGKCKYCGQRAFLSHKSANETGLICYECALGRNNVNYPSVEAKIQFMDLLLIGSTGEMVEVMLDKSVFSADKEHKVHVESALEVMVYNRKYAVWEPVVEPSKFEVEGAIDENRWRFIGHRLFFVPSVFAIQTISAIAGQFDTQLEQSIIPVRIHNFTSEVIVIDESHKIESDQFLDCETERIKRTFTLTHKMSTIDVPLDRTSFVASSECVAEIDVQQNSTVIRVIPFHSSGGIVKVVSEVNVALELQGSRKIQPEGVLYLPAGLSLENPFVVQPVDVPGDAFMASDPGSGKRIPQFIDILRGYRPSLHCQSAHSASSSMHFKTFVRSEGTASGIPIFSIVVSGCMVAQNVTPCTLHLQMARGRTGDEVGNVILEPGQKTHLYHATSIAEYRFCLQVAQGDNVFTSGQFSLNEDSDSLILRDAAKKEMRLQVAASNEMIGFSAPFALLNHTVLNLTCTELSQRGLASASHTNYATLEAQSDILIPITPSDDPDELFVHIEYDKFKTQDKVPLHVMQQQRIELIDTASRDTIQICCQTSMNSLGTRIVTITPRWIVCNRSQQSLCVGQDLGTSSMNLVELAPGTSQHFYPARAARWKDKNNTDAPGQDVYKMLVSQDRQSAVDGTGFPIDAHHDAFVLAKGATGPPKTIQVNVVPKDSYTYIVLEDPKEPPYIFINRTPINIKMTDFYSNETLCVAPAHAITNFPYISTGCLINMPHLNVKSDMITLNIGASDKIPLNLLAPTPPHEQNFEDNLKYEVSKGTHGQLILTLKVDVSSTTSLIQRSPRSALSIAATCRLLSFSVVNHPIELVHAVFTELAFKLNRAAGKEHVSFSIQNYQIDNQTEEAPPFPCAVCPIRSPKGKKPSISFTMDRKIVEAQGVLVIKQIVCSLDEIAVHISDSFLIRIFQFLKALNDVPDASTKCPTEVELFKDAPSHGGAMATQVSIDEMVVNPIRVRLWFQREPDADFLVETMAQSKLISLFAMSLEDVKIAVPGIAEKEQNHRAFTLVGKLSELYVQKIKNGVGAVVLQYIGAIPLIGAPIKAVADIGSGAVHFFTDPIDGLTESPEAFALGVARGTTHLVGGVIGGAFGVISNVTGSVAKGASMLEGKKRKTTKNQPRTNTITGIGKGVLGLFTKPVEGLAEDGAAGFAKGVGRGVVGLVTSPLSGIMNDVATVSGTVAEVVTGDYLQKADRMRKLRLFHAGGGVAQYGSLIETHQYMRKYHGDKWVANMLDTKDGPKWNPATRETLASRHHMEDPVWFVDKTDSNFDGWQHAEEYYGVYHMLPFGNDLIRRRRWVTVAKERTHSNIAPAVQRVVLTAPDAMNVSQSSFAFSNNTPTAGGGNSETPAASSRGFTPGSPSFAVATASQQTTRIVETYENQRWYPIRGWSTKLLPTDRSGWSTRDGSGKNLTKESFRLDPGWEWADEWHSVGGDGAHWEYAMDFPMTYIPKDRTGYCVRRRCWRRTMKKSQQ